MNLCYRSYKKELLDQENIPFDDIMKNMQELNFINTWLGGHAISVKGLKEVIGQKKQATICEIGCGGGDNIHALNRWCKKNGIDARFIGIDIKAECIQFAKSRVAKPKMEWIVSNYENVYFETKPDVIFSSLFCHHFTNEELVTQLRWMAENSTTGFFINDLERHPAAYYAIKTLTAIFSSSYLVKNDAPLSVARGFKKAEWIEILQAAGLKNFKVDWMWAFRYLITYKHE